MNINLANNINIYNAKRADNARFRQNKRNNLAPLKTDMVIFTSKLDDNDDFDLLFCEELSKKLYGEDVQVFRKGKKSDTFYVSKPHCHFVATGVMGYKNNHLNSITLQEHDRDWGSLDSIGEIKVFNIKGELIKHLSQKQAKELRAYRGNMAININSILRHNGENNEFWKPYIDTMDSMFQSDKIYSRTTENITVYRGVNVNPDIFTPGSITTEKGYMSTSKDKNIAKKNGELLFEISVPKGTKYLDMPLLTKVSDFYIEEQEMLFNRNTKLKITGYDSETNVIKAEILQ